MTRRILTGVYPAGYVVARGVTTLGIASSAYVEGSGVRARARLEIVNSGRIVGADTAGYSGVTLGRGGGVTNKAGGVISGYEAIDVALGPGALVNDGAVRGVGADDTCLVFAKGGVVDNRAGGTIDGAGAGISIKGGGVVVNDGRITAARYEAVALYGGGSVANAAGGLVTAAAFGVTGLGGAVTVANAGVINATAGGRHRGVPLGDGVFLVAGGLVANAAGGVISGVHAGVYLAYAAGAVTNAGTIVGTKAAGVALAAGGVVINGGAGDDTALIEGEAGVAAAGAASTVVNFGTIAGGAYSVLFESAGGVLIAESGARFVGAIVGGGGGLEVDGGDGVITDLGGAGVLSGADNGAFSGFDAYTIGAGGHWRLAGAADIAAGESLTIAGAARVVGVLDQAPDARLTIAASGVLAFAAPSGGALDGPVVNDGVLATKGADVSVAGAVSGGGRCEVDGGALELDGAFDQAVTFVGGTGELALALSQTFTAAVSGFSADAKQSFDLRDIGFVDAGEATFSGTAAGGVLTVSDGTRTARINLVGDYLGDAFEAASDGRGGVRVTAAMAAPPAFIAAMAGLNRDGAAPVQGGPEPRRGPAIALAAPT